jgi:glycosyltransferase involved in cell wall biosynthesis
MNVAVDGMLLNRLCTGVETVILNLARSLFETGRFNYTLFISQKIPYTDWNSSRFKTVAVSGPVYIKLFRILYQQTLLPLKLSKGQYDLFHATGYTAPLRIKIPFVVSVYDLIALDYPELCPLRNRLHFRMFLPATIRRATGIIVPSEQTRMDIERRFQFVTSKIRVIKPGVSAIFHPEPEPLKMEQTKQHYGIPSRYILFVGRLEAKKNLECLINAFHLLKSHNRIPHKLLLIGSRGYRAGSIFRRIQLLGLNSEVIVREGVVETDLPLLYKGADLFVFPSFYEGFGLPVLEAMACGTAVVISKHGALPETAGDSAFVVEPLSPQTLAEGIEKVLTDNQLRRTLVEKGLNHAKSFTWTSYAQRVEQFYEECLEQTKDCRKKI